MGQVLSSVAAGDPASGDSFASSSGSGVTTTTTTTITTMLPLSILESFSKLLQQLQPTRRYQQHLILQSQSQTQPQSPRSLSFYSQSDSSSSSSSLSSSSATSSPSSSSPTSTYSPLLHLPTDIILLIRDHLDPATVIAVSLACRDTRAALCYSPNTTNFRNLAAPQKKQLAQLIERDPRHGRGLVYCFPCNVLHPFRDTWFPQSRAEDEEPRRGPRHCGRRDRFVPVGNQFGLTFTHARLVMNRHLYGDAHGLPLSSICISHTQAREAVSVRCDTAARILDDELFLLRTYTFSVPRAAVAALRKCTGARDFRVCEHTSFFSDSSVYRQYIPELQRCAKTAGGADDDALVPCEDSPGSCGLCLMDYEITINETPSGPNNTHKGSSSPGWHVTIRAYHQVGSCRTPDDWKWARFSESCRPSLFFPNRPNRRSSTQYPGAVKSRWFEDDEVRRHEDEQRRQRERMRDDAAAEMEVALRGLDTGAARRLGGLPAWLWNRAKPLAIKYA